MRGFLASSSRVFLAPALGSAGNGPLPSSVRPLLHLPLRQPALYLSESGLDASREHAAFSNVIQYMQIFDCALIRICGICTTANTIASGPLCEDRSGLTVTLTMAINEHGRLIEGRRRARVCAFNVVLAVRRAKRRRVGEGDFTREM